MTTCHIYYSSKCDKGNTKQSTKHLQNKNKYIVQIFPTKHYFFQK